MQHHINHPGTEQSAFFPILQTIGLIAVIGDGVEKKSISVLAGLALILEIYTYVIAYNKSDIFLICSFLISLIKTQNNIIKKV